MHIRLVRNDFRRPKMTVLASLFVQILLVLIVIIGSVHGRKRRNGHPQSRSVRVLNQSGVKVDIFWIHPETGELAESNTNGEGIMFGAESGIDSYVGHEFEVREVENSKTKKCRNPNNCLKGYFEVNVNEDQIITLGKDLKTITIEDNKSRAMAKAKEALDGCSELANAIKEATALSSDDSQQILLVEQLTECLQKQIKNKMDETNDEIQFQANTRKDMGIKLKQYICNLNENNQYVPDLQLSDKQMTTDAVRNSSWVYYITAPVSATPGKKAVKSKGQNHPIRILFESSYSSISLVKDFVTKDQCQKLIKGAEDEPKETTHNNQLDIRNITTKLVKTNNDFSEFIMKVGSLLSSVDTRVGDDYYGAKSAENNDEDSTQLMQIRFLLPSSSTQPPKVEQQKQKQDCEIQPDGSCVQVVSDDDTKSNNDDATERILITNSNNTTIASLIIICQGPATSSSPTVDGEEKTSSITAKTSIPPTSGLIFFPKAGVKVLPSETVGDAILIIHEDDTGTRDDDPFVDEYITCPVIPPSLTAADNNNVVVTIEDSI